MGKGKAKGKAKFKHEIGRLHKGMKWGLNLLFLMIIVITLYVFLILPQSKYAKTLESEVKATIQQIDFLNQQLDLYDSLIYEYNTLYLQITLLKNNYYIDIIQEQLILLIQDYQNSSNIDIESIVFTDPIIISLNALELVSSDNTIEEININIQFVGLYDEILSFLNFIENSPKIMAVISTNINRIEENRFRGTITLKITTIPFIDGGLDE